MKVVYFAISLLVLVVAVNLVRDPSLLSSIKVPDLSVLQKTTRTRTEKTADVSSLVGQSSKFLLMVKGDEAAGSASVIKWKGNSLIVTNIHVLSGNANPSFRSLNGQQIVPDTLGVAPDRDILVASQHQLQGGLEASTDVASDVTIGDEVIILGNSLGSDVATEVNGKILGVGPDLIETDAKFVHGNSGSPIIHVKTGRVIAIATFATVRKLDTLAKGSQFTTVRRFGYRIDTVPNWQFMTGKGFAEESGLIGEIKQRSEDLFVLTREAWNNHYVRAQYCSEQGWARGAVNTICDAGYRQGVGAMRYEQAFNAFRDRRNEDIRVAQQTKLIPYHQKELVKEIKEREALEHYLERIDWDRVRFDR